MLGAVYGGIATVLTAFSNKYGALTLYVLLLVTVLIIVAKIIDSGDSTYRNKYGIKYSDENTAKDYVIVLTDGANGPDGNDPIEEDDDGVLAVRENADFLAAIEFGSEAADTSTKAYADLLTITDDADKIYLASSQTQLQAAFDAIVSSIGSDQSNEGKL